MDAKTLQEYINNHNLHRIAEQKSYYMGKHPAILAPMAKPAPDARISVPFLRKAVDDMAGYMAKPGLIQYEGDGYEEVLSPIFDDNEEPIITQNLFKKSCIHGIAFEVHWMEGGKDQFAIIPNEQGIPVYSNDIRPKLLEFIWIKKIGDVNQAVIYGPQSVDTWVDNKGWQLIDSEPHGYNKVPVVIYTINFDKENLFDHVREIVDLYDRLLSQDISNEAARYQAAILAMAERIDSTPDENGFSMVDKLKQIGVIDGLGSDQPVQSKIGFITKDVPTAFIQLALTTSKNLIYEMLGIPNPDQQNGSSETSGYAMALKNMTFEFLCSSIEGNFIRGLQDRIRLIAGHTIYNFDGTQISVKMGRNTPFDLERNATVAAQLTGIWDKEAILSLFPPTILSDDAKERILSEPEDEGIFSGQETQTEPESSPEDDMEDNQEDMNSQPDATDDGL
jgi:SPP1 family phage portal protein